VSTADTAAARAMALHAADLEARDRRQTQLLANVAHDLRTPLTAIITHAEILRDGLLGELEARQRDSVAAIIRGGHELLSMIGEILDYARTAADQITLNPTTFAPGEAITEVAALNEPLAIKHALTMTVDVAGLSPITADRERFIQILENLLGNAITYTPAGGRVWITACEHDRELVVEVGDTGIGIAPEHHAYVFQEFAQVDTSRSRTHHGTGLGLTIARRLAELHDGRVWLESAPGIGSRFFLAIPRPAIR
jgi:signal transduction histidine kinase